VTEGREEDSVVKSRERARTVAGLGKRFGYGCFFGALILFLINYYVASSTLWTSLTVALLIVGSLLLAPAIILGYAANAAEREEQGLPHGH
jgi:sugar phosphate permease